MERCINKGKQQQALKLIGMVSSWENVDDRREKGSHVAGATSLNKEMGTGRDLKLPRAATRQRLSCPAPQRGVSYRRDSTGPR